MDNLQKMPAIFIGHGSPENAFRENEFSLVWKHIATLFPKPKAILIISAHWTNNIDTKTRGTSITTNEKLETIHDFYGFPENFYDYSYPAPSDTALAKKIITLTKAVKINGNNNWGLDHGAWSVLAQMYPAADIPVLQLSIDEKISRETLFTIGRELAKFREDGVLILGSGNIVHNLREIEWNGKPKTWATDFDLQIKNALIKKDVEQLIKFEKNPLSSLALPTVEHFLPLLYVVGASNNEDPKFFCEKIFSSSLSMRCVAYGI
jgi:4,5-DOPA dioxygenase extradiol